MSLPSHPGLVLLAGSDAAAVTSLQPAAEMLASFGISIETAVIQADESGTYSSEDACAVIVASPDAALPAALAQLTDVPVIRVPVETGGRTGLALLNDGHGHLPAGPADGVFATMAIGQAGARNAALFVVSSLAGQDERLHAAWAEFRAWQTEAVLHHPPLILED